MRLPELLGGNVRVRGRGLPWWSFNEAAGITRRKGRAYALPLPVGHQSFNEAAGITRRKAAGTWGPASWFRGFNEGAGITRRKDTIKLIQEITTSLLQ